MCRERKEGREVGRRTGPEGNHQCIGMEMEILFGSEPTNAINSRLNLKQMPGLLFYSQLSLINQTHSFTSPFTHASYPTIMLSFMMKTTRVAQVMDRDRNEEKAEERAKTLSSKVWYILALFKGNAWVLA